MNAQGQLVIDDADDINSTLLNGEAKIESSFGGRERTVWFHRRHNKAWQLIGLGLVLGGGPR